MKRTYQVLIAAAVIAVLAGCSSPKYKSNMGGDANANGANGTETSGVGGADQFNGQGMSSDGGMSTLSAADQAQVAALNKIVYFAFDSNKLDAAGTTVASANASFLLKHPSISVLLAGHADPRGSQEYNFHLGERRADTVKDYFMQQGVAASQICTVSYGDLKPAASPASMNGNWKKAYQLDRRVEVQYGQGCQTGAAAPVAASANGAL